MIYKPQESLGLANYLYAGFIKALTKLAADFNAGTNKPWTYYLGIGIGGACAATGVPGAAATAYVVAAALDVWIFKSPEGSIVKFYVNGLQQAVIDASSATSEWVKVTITTNPAQRDRVDIENGEPGEFNTSGISWLAISQLETPGYVILDGVEAVSVTNISIQLEDFDANPKSVIFPVPTGSLTLAQITTYAQTLAADLDDVSEAKITGITVELQIALPGGLKPDPVDYSNVQEGALFSFNAAGTVYSHGIFVPAFDQTKFSGKSVNLADTDVAELVATVVDGDTISGTLVAVSDKYENDLTGVKSAKKRFRK